MMMPYLGNGAR